MPAIFYIKHLITLLLVSTLFSCTQPTSALQTVIDRGELIVFTRIDPTTYNIDISDNPYGFEYELVTLFAEKIGVRVRFILPDQFHHILQLNTESEADFAAAGLSITPNREKNLLFTPAYYEVTQQVIYHYRSRRPKSIQYLKDSFFEVLAGTSHTENLRLLSKSSPELSWTEAYNTNIIELMTLVNDGLLDYTIADSNQFQTFRSQFPQLNAAFDISSPEKIAWAFPNSKDNSLYNEAVDFLNEVKNNGVLNQLQDKHFGYSKNLNYVGICTFRRHVKSRLPALTSFFHQAAEKHNIDWRLLAAVAYQESHWNKHAVSPTGVRGIMMLTRSTAKQMGVTDRLDPQQSIDGGARYLVSRMKRIPARIQEPDKTWMALASYNIGYGHLEDARILTQKQGGNPDRWVDVKERLPLLTQKKWYAQTKYGYARGNEPVTYIENVRHYLKMLKELEPDEVKHEETPLTKDAFNMQVPAL